MSDLRELGRTGLRVSNICVGAASLGRASYTYGYPVSEEQGEATVEAALAGPYNFLDTSNAYGGGASQDSGVAAFRFYSYRDPRLEQTLDDFDTAVAWMLDTPHGFRALEEAILGVIGSLDKPSSPAGEAKQHFHNRLFGRTHETREQFRQQVLAVSLDDLRRVTETYLKPELASTAILTSAAQREKTGALRERLGLTVEEL